MALTPDEIERRTFTIGDWGYERGEVHAFLSEVAATLRYTHHQSMHWIVAGDEERDSASQEVTDEARAEARQLLAAAQRQAAEVVEAARRRADAMLADARADAEHLRRQAQTRVQRTALVEADARRRIEDLREELLESLALLDGSDARPIIDLTGDGAVLRLGRQTAGPTVPTEPADRAPTAATADGDAASPESVGADDGRHPDDDRVSVLVRSAVARAVSAARGDEALQPAATR